MQELVIETSNSKKSRAFRAVLLAHVEADALWAGGATGTDTTRPVWMMLAGTDSELRAFTANLQGGRKAELRSKNSYSSRVEGRFELLKSAGYQFVWQRASAGSIVTAYLPDIFRLDPGMVDPTGAGFCLLPARDWIRPPAEGVLKHLVDLGVNPEQPELPMVLGLAPLFIAYLDRRTRCPLIPDPRFYAQVLYAALGRGLASKSGAQHYYRDNSWGCHNRLGYKETRTVDVGLAEGLAFQADHESLETFLAEQVKVYDARIHGTT